MSLPACSHPACVLPAALDAGLHGITPTTLPLLWPPLRHSPPQVELLTRVATLLLRLHMQQLMGTPAARPLLLDLQTLLRQRVQVGLLGAHPMPAAGRSGCASAQRTHPGSLNAPMVRR